MKKLNLIASLVLLLFFLNACGKNYLSVKDMSETQTRNIVAKLMGEEQEKEVEVTVNIPYPEITGFSDKAFEEEVNRIIKETAEQLDITDDDAILRDIRYEILNLPTKGNDILSILYTCSSYYGGNYGFPSMIILNVDVKNKKILGNRAEDWDISIGNIYLMNYAIMMNSPNDRFESMQIDESGNGDNRKRLKDLQFGVKNDSIVFVFWSTDEATADNDFAVIPYIPMKKIMDVPAKKEFEDFLSLFCTDRKFQLSRIKFPVGEKWVPSPELCPEDDPDYSTFWGDCSKRVPLTEENWEPINQEILTPFFEENETCCSYGYWDRSVTIAEFLMGVDLDLYGSYKFEKIAGNWYLTNCFFVVGSDD